MIATHSERHSGHRLCKIEKDWRGFWIFSDLDDNGSRITCPDTIDYVIPYHDRSQVLSVHEAV